VGDRQAGHDELRARLGDGPGRGPASPRLIQPPRSPRQRQVEEALRKLILLSYLLSIPGLLLSTWLLLGAGVLRHGGATAVAAGAALLLLLPAMGVASLFPRRLHGLGLGLLLWPLGLLIGFPLYFPAERGPALVAGLSVAAGALQLHPDPSIALALDRLLPAVEGSRPPAVLAESTQVEPLALATAAPEPAATSGRLGEGEDEVVLPYEGSGSSLLVQISLEQGSRSQDVVMIFDTGASITTLDTETLRSLGVRVPADAPVLEVHTAGGDRQTRLVRLDRLWIGGFEVEGVTVGVCDDCRMGRTVGLLGLNVSSRFLVTVDQQEKELVLQPRAGVLDATADVSPWVDLSATATRWEGGRTEVEVRVLNKSDHPISTVGVRIGCGAGFHTDVGPIAPGAEAEKPVALPLGTDCEAYTVELDRARW
jgi:clan AA aspartic protease (TIGR02281 family)